MSIESSGRRESSHSSRHRRFASDSLNPPFLKPLLAYCSMATASIAGSASRTTLALRSSSTAKSILVGAPQFQVVLVLSVHRGNYWVRV